ncbi:hypothetical protein MLD38_013523 [Melastoma candidum]|uniref:Uncharacterized protein n=1 Tax=Melastoma candidum TaxID=119954 RepID=A0ACB9RIC0_9MYRT|nr:hypothetical protein MLD38_013523 [Melastoma candidum]
MVDRNQKTGMDDHRCPKPNPNPNPNPDSVAPASSLYKGKSCKGCLYYSSLKKAKSQPPTCVGISRKLQQVPGYTSGNPNSETSKDGLALLDFRYACLGYSVFLEKSDQSSNPQDKQPNLPFCVGLEVLLDKRNNSAGTEHAPAHVRKHEDTHAFPQRRAYNTTTSTGDDYFSRFKRNASLVASGVAKNMNKVGNYIKESLDDIFYPYRRRPK